MRDKSVSGLLITVLMTGMLCACSAPEKVPEDRFYRLSLLSAKQRNEPVLDGALVVGPVTAYDVYRDRAIAYSPPEEPGSLQHHHYHFWVAPPPELVREQLVDYLRKSGIAKVVTIESPGRGQRAARLATRLTRFERVLQPDGAVSFSVGFQVALDHEGKVRLRERYDGTTTAADGSFPSSVRAADEGLARIYSEMVGDIAAALDNTRH